MEQLLREQLKEAAREKGICEDGFSKLSADDVASLVDYYIQHPDWGLSHDFPSIEVLREYSELLESKGVYVEKTFTGELLNDRQAYVFIGCKGKISVGLNVEKRIIPMLYFGNKCRMRVIGVGEITPRQATKVPIYAYGKNDISAHTNKYVKFNIYER